MRRVLFVLCLLSLAPPVFAGNDKLDLMLRDFTEQDSASKASLEKVFSMGAPSLMLGKSTGLAEEAQVIEVLVKSKDTDLTTSFVEDENGTVLNTAGNIMVVRLPVDSLSALSDLDEVEYIEASKRMSLKMDTARTHTNAASLQSGAATGSALAGTDVIVGVVDDGFDYDNSDFFGADNTTRVQFVRRRQSDGRYQVCVKSEIDAATCAIPSTSTFHGTHVTGIAASSDVTYKGMAPDADIFFVYNSFNSDTAETSAATSNVTTFSGAVLDGVSQIFAGADVLDKPAVVNLSLGTSLGAHDDTSLLEQGLNALVGGAGRIIVNAAGNENVVAANGPNAGGIHAAISVSAGTDKAYRFGAINTGVSTYGGVFADMWFAQSDNCTVTAHAYKAGNDTDTSASRASVGPISISSDSSSSTNTDNDGTATISIGVDAVDTNNSRPHAQVILTKASGASWASIVTDGTSVGYVIDIVVSATTGTCSGSIWLYPDFTAYNDFLTNIAGNTVSGTGGYTLANGDSNKTITIPGTASGVITVGSYMQEKPLSSGNAQWVDINGTTRDQTNTSDTGTGGTVGDVSIFSSLGPTGEISSSRIKPEVIAPGEPVISTLSADASVSSSRKVAGGEHFKLEGTSMSSPQVAGIVALILQYNNTLTISQMKTLLQNGATAFGTSSTAGSGKVDAAAAIALTSADTSAFSGTRDLTTSDVGTDGFSSGTTSSGCSLIIR
ncbi:MAG: hypothetical protein COX62_05865 [Deltaproteobacteria bacterium CG_4_10_14_0_2_um_filter_43_8]|nr:MAG: hypothetical protein COX62_05865 [Deltaproteobacteria bacterium CG_4_10_14_0_2_um_filter_43_8]PJC64763.1 MAG: hypothetical protein CO021_02580 [Deltaproteobacteria bacterium CG_4_9_14_0_2_um_filter_42_21]